LIDDHATTYCSGAVGTCTDDLCCKADVTKCGGIGGVTCQAPYYYNAAKAGVAATATTKNTVCCTAPATCEAVNFQVTLKDPCPTPAPGAGGGGGGGGGTGGTSGGGSGTASGGFRVVPAVFATSWLMATFAFVL